MNQGTPISHLNAEHYTWGMAGGAACDGWHLVRTPELSVIQERMPPGTSEARHFHERARQFFFVLEGEAVLEVEGMEHQLTAQQGLEVAPVRAHQLFNRAAADLHFLVISQPPSHGDRVLAPNT